MFEGFDFGAILTAAGIAKLGQIIVGDLTMAGDNVVIMGSLASGLPPRDRRKVLIGLTALTALVEIGIYWSGKLLVGWPFVITGFVLGGIISTQYYASSAYTDDITGHENAVGVASALLFLYCIGAVLGPITAYYVMHWLGDPGLYLHNAGIHAAMAVFILLRVLRSPGRDKADTTTI